MCYLVYYNIKVTLTDTTVAASANILPIDIGCFLILTLHVI